MKRFFGVAVVLFVFLLVSVSCDLLALEETVSGVNISINGTLTAFKDVPVEELTITKEPSSARGTFSIAPALPKGLEIDQDSGTISGTPETIAPFAAYTVIFTGARGFGRGYGNASQVVRIGVIGLGSAYGGGIVFYLDGKGGGLIAATSDQSTGIKWNDDISIPGADGTAIGTGEQNTKDIVAKLGSGSYAAKIASDYSVTVSGVTYDDWFLPSKDELNEMYKHKVTIGGFGKYYWSSSEYSSYTAWLQDFDDGGQYYHFKHFYLRVRVVRAF